MAAESYRSACHSLLLASKEVPGVISFVVPRRWKARPLQQSIMLLRLPSMGQRSCWSMPTCDSRHSRILWPGARSWIAKCAAADSAADLAWAIAQQPGLSVLTAGDSMDSGSRALDAKSVAPLIAQWRASYDYVVIDAPPATLVSDTLVLSACADAAVLISQRNDHAAGIRRTRDALQRAHANVNGVVLNAGATAHQFGFRTTD